jgi:hypothetical protein
LLATRPLIANDAIRTFLNPLPVSLPIVYWGRGGGDDLMSPVRLLHVCYFRLPT